MRHQPSSKLSLWLQRLLTAPSDRGATSTEYALMAGFIAAAIVTGVAALGVQTKALFTMGLHAFL